MPLQVEGRRPVIEALKGSCQVEKVLVSRDARGKTIDEIVALARKNRIRVQTVSRKALDQQSQTHNHQGVIAVMAAISYRELNDVVQTAKQAPHPFLLILDQITDPHNLGAIVRTADAAGVNGVIIPRHRAVGLTPTVVKVSAGASLHVPVARVNNIARTIDLLKEEGFWLVAADVKGKQFHYEVDYNMPVGLVIGSEGSGIRRLVLEKCDFVVKLPMLGQVESLNASVAAGILMYEVVRQHLSLQ